MYNARAQLLFCSLTFLFSDVPIPVVVEVFVRKIPNKRFWENTSTVSLHQWLYLQGLAQRLTRCRQGKSAKRTNVAIVERRAILPAIVLMLCAP